MKRLFSLVALALVLVAGIAEADEKSPFSFVLRTQLWSEFLNQGGAVVYDRPQFQSSLFATHKATGIYGGLFLLNPADLGEFDKNFGTEIDYYLGYGAKAGNFGYTFGVAYFDLVNLFESPKKDLVQAYGEATYHFAFGKHDVAPFLRLEYTRGVPGTNSLFLDTLRGFAGLDHEWPVEKRFTFRQRISFIMDDGEFMKGESATIFQWDPTLRIHLTPSVSFDASLRLSNPVTSTSTRRFELAPWLGINFSF